MKLLKIFFISTLFIFIILQSSICKQKINDSTKINFPQEYNYKQSYFDCGPYSCLAVINALGNNKKITMKKILKDIKYRMRNKYTLPMGITALLKKYGYKADAKSLKKYSKTERILYLKKNLTMKKPVIILGEINGIQHYVTVLGYNKDYFFIYDSALKKNPDKNYYTVDENGKQPGNRTINKNQLLSFWSKGGEFNLFTWYAITVKKK